MEKREKLPVFVGNADIHSLRSRREMLACFPTLGIHVPYVLQVGRSTEIEIGKPTRCDDRCEHFTGSMNDWNNPKHLGSLFYPVHGIIEAAREFHAKQQAKDKAKKDAK